MSELRQDATTREWVIIATERARRPHEFSSPKPEENAAALPEYSEKCPFCPGHESLTPEEVFAIREGGQKNGPCWQVRVVPNKFAALTPTEELARSRQGTFRGVVGFGHHEVLIETPKHNRPMALMEVWELERIMYAFRSRYKALRADPKIQLIVIFKNHGRAAGTSIEHPHSQIVAVPIIPGGVRAKIEVAQRYYDDNGKCVYCALLDDELAAAARIVLETEDFVAFHPYASKVPFETWIMPRAHSTSFGNNHEEECFGVAPVLKKILAKIYVGLQNPDFNFILHVAPVEYEDAPYYHWHIQVLPRLTLQAGFELGSGIFINSALPEQTAQFMREVEA
jgi:UDPglucose--hexose-1-phosphate uridylyltransferase